MPLKKTCISFLIHIDYSIYENIYREINVKELNLKNWSKIYNL